MTVLKKYIIAFSILIYGFSLAYADENTFGGIIKFDKIVHNFGDILISDGPQKCKFTFTNISKEPIAIYDIITSCGCTDPKWDKQPVMPGKNGVIEVTFLNDQGPYPFDKSLTLYVSGLNKPLNLHIRGVAHDRKKSLRELYPFIYDNSLALRNNKLTLNYIDQGSSKGEETDVVNISKKAASVTFKNVTPGLTIKVEPNPIPANGKAVLSYSVDTKKNKNTEWGKVIYTTEVLINGQNSGKTISVDAYIKENFSNLSEQQKKDSPLPMLSNSSKDFGKIKRGDILKTSVTIKNQGKSELQIYKSESNIEGVTIKSPMRVSPGKSEEVAIEINTSKHDSSELMIIVTLITNSPTRPFVNFFITASIEK